MAAWLIPALKAVLPHVGTIISAAAPAFTKKKAVEVMANVNETALMQQQISELQTAVSQNAAHIKELAEQLQSTVGALEGAAELAETKLRRAQRLCGVAAVISILAFSAALLVILAR